MDEEPILDGTCVIAASFGLLIIAALTAWVGIDADGADVSHRLPRS